METFLEISILNVDTKIRIKDLSPHSLDTTIQTQ